jgi:hypothetical protein
LIGSRPEAKQPVQQEHNAPPGFPVDDFGDDVPF